MIKTQRAYSYTAPYGALVSTIVWACVGCAFALSTVDFYRWLIDGTLTTGSNTFHAAAHSAFIALIIAISLGLIITGWKLLPRIIAASLLVILCMQLANHFSAISVTSVTLLRAALPGFSFTHELIALNEILVFLFLTLSLFGLTFRRASTTQSALILVLSLLGLSISGFALYGYLLGSESAYWWATDLRMMPSSALVNVALGMGFIFLTWDHLNASSSDLVHILRGISLISAAILSITVVLAACFAIIPLYESLLGTIYQEVKSSVRSKRADLTHFIGSFETSTKAALINTQRVLPTESTTYSLSYSNSLVLNGIEILATLPGVEKIEYISIEKLSTYLLREFQDSSLSQIISKRPYVWSAPSENGDVALFIEIPLSTMSGEDVGAFRATIFPAFLMQMLGQNTSEIINRGEFYLISRTPLEVSQALRYQVGTKNFELLPQESIFPRIAHITQDENLSEELSSRRLLRAENLEILLPINNSQMKFGFSTKVSSLRTLLFKKLVRIIAGLLVLVLISGGLILLLLSKLGDQVLQLESKLLISFKQLGEELTLRKKAQADAEKSLQEKEVLLKEIHHRVKNNLQVISSIINLQLRRTSIPEIGTTLQESSNRIQSIALLHETLYRSHDITNIPLRDYFTELTHYLLASYQAENKVQVNIAANNLSLEIDKAIPLGLILTELLTNSFKYAFPATRSKLPQPSIHIETVSLLSQELAFIYRDNGIGFPEDFSFETASSLGSRLIDSLCQQLKGTIITRSHQGVEIKIIFPYVGRFKKEDYYEQAANFDS